jgi:hypothetical protein
MIVIGSFLIHRRIQLASLTVLAFLALHSVAEDRITKTDGSVISGRIAGVSGNQVMFEGHTSSGGVAKFPVSIIEIQSVAMETPAEVTKAEAPGVPPNAVIAALEPQVKQFAGLPTDWVVDAIVQLGDAYAAADQVDRALATYNQISQSYPNSAYEKVATAAKAGLSLKAGKVDEARAMVQPIIDEANKDVAPSPSSGAIYAHAYMVYGQVLEAQKKPQQALEAYLTVKTMYYQNPDLAAQADQRAKNLRDHNPGLSIE